MIGKYIKGNYFLQLTYWSKKIHATINQASFQVQLTLIIIQKKLVAKRAKTIDILGFFFQLICFVCYSDTV